MVLSYSLEILLLLFYLIFTHSLKVMLPTSFYEIVFEQRVTDVGLHSAQEAAKTEIASVTHTELSHMSGVFFY